VAFYAALIPRTLRGRLVLAAVGSIVAAVALFAVATVLVVGHELRSSLDRDLRQRAQQVAQLAVSAPAVLTSPGALESPVSGRQIVVEVLDARGRIISRSLTLGARLLPEDRVLRAARVGGRAGYETIDLGGAQFRVYAAPIADAGGPAAGGAVIVASDTTDIRHTVRHLGSLIAVIGALVALVAGLVAAILTRRGLRPLSRLADAAGEIEKTADPTKRLPEPAVADELARLSGVLNRMLAALERAGQSERRFLADASHELRTPVTALLGNVEYAARHGADADVLADMRRDAARLARLVDDLLVLERVGAAEPSLEPLALDDLARRVVGALEEAGDRVVLKDVEPVRVLGEPEALRRVLENLIENALVHGPADGRVFVGVGARDGRALLSVRDEGPGLDPAQLDRVFERFWRAPDAAQRPGSGLGLSIVAAVVERHGGRVEVDGSRFTVDLPTAGAGGG
jgi:signal transduction histidine kinase